MSDAQEDKSAVGLSETQPPPSAAEANVANVTNQDAPGSATWSAGQGLFVRYAGRSAVGLVREHNEDNFVIANLTSGELSSREVSLIDPVGEGGLLFAVCDGMGGAAAGEVASQMAVDALHEEMRRGGFPRERDELARRLVAAVEEAGRRIFEAAQKERSRRGMGTTATAAVLVDKVLFIAEVGDSRAYMLRGGTLKQLTKDQSLVNQLIEAGHLTEAEAEAFEHSNIILQALGTSETVQVDLTFVELRRGDRLMLCSDGLSGLVHADTLRDTLAAVDDPAECTATLIKYAEAGGGHDNITVVVMDFDGSALEAAGENDSFGYLQYPLLPAGTVGGAFSDEEITEASVPPRRSNYDSLPALEPEAGRGTDASPWLWVSAGLLALLLGAWLLAASDGAGSATADDERATERGVAPALPRAEPTEPPEAKPVPVRVFSDVQDAVLLVNGEARGRLASGEGRSMDLRPGAYRFEAQSNGNIAAVEVVTVRPDVPLEVYLRLPSGMNDPSAQPPAAEAPHEPTEPTEPAEPATAVRSHEEPPSKPSALKPEAKPKASPAEPKASPSERKAAAASETGHAARVPKEPKSKPASEPTMRVVPTAPAAVPAPSHPPAKAPGAIPDNPF
jgi:serine/threonine protein phosphatase PrpC